MKINKLVVALLVWIVGAALVRSSYGYPALPGQKYGAGTMPFLLGIAGMGMGCALFLQSWNIRGDVLVQLTFQNLGRATWGGLATIIASIAYIALADEAGFISVATAILFSLMWLGNIPPKRALAISVITALLSYVVFSRFLLVPLPSGPIETALWQAILG